MKTHRTLWLLALGLMAGSTMSTRASAAPEMNDKRPDVLVYMQPVEYTNPIRLWHPYYDYWFYQGPLVEQVAVQKLGQSYGKVEVCDANQSGKMLVWLQPKMFYNPQVQQFYGKVTVDVYTGIGKHLGTYVGEANVRGLIGVNAEKTIQQSYALAMDQAIHHMKADNALQAQINSPEANTANSTPCSMVTLLPSNKLRRALPF